MVGAAVLLAVWSNACTELDPDADTCIDYGTCDDDAIGSAGTGGSGGGGGGTAGTGGRGVLGDPNAAPADSEAWSCLGGGPIQPDMATATTVTYAAPILDWNTTQPPGPLTISLCGQLDPDCAEAVRTMQMQPAFPYAVQLPAGYSNLMRIEVANGAMGDDAYVPELYYFHGQVNKDTRGNVFLVLKKSQLRQLLQDIYGADAAANLETTGVLVIRAIGCDGQRVPGVRFETDRGPDTGILPYTLVYPAQPRGWNSEEEPIYTDVNGSAGFVNVPQGSITVTGFRQGSDVPYGTRTVVIRPGVMTFVEIRPDNYLVGQ